MLVFIFFLSKLCIHKTQMKFSTQRILMEANHSADGSCGDRRTKEKSINTGSQNKSQDNYYISKHWVPTSGVSSKWFASCQSRIQNILRDLMINGQKINLHDAKTHNKRTYNDYDYIKGILCLRKSVCLQGLTKTWAASNLWMTVMWHEGQ